MSQDSSYDHLHTLALNLARGYTTDGGTHLLQIIIIMIGSYEHVTEEQHSNGY